MATSYNTFWLQETATTLIGMLLGMAFTHTFDGELQPHQHA